MNDTERITFLQTNFGFKNFRPGQLEVIQHLQNQRNTLAILPTGSGKTLLYQYYGLWSHKSVIVISPLLSLMQDQVSRLQYLGSKRVVAITSQLAFNERQYVLNHIKHYQYIYVSPEMLDQEPVKVALRQLELGLVVVDEAHCLSEWGPDFRPDYLSIKDNLLELGNPLVLMLSATADETTRTDIITKLGLQFDQVNQVIKSVDRPNIYLTVQHLENESDKNMQLIELVKKLRGTGVIYFSSKKKVNEISQLLTAKTNKRVMPYHGDLDSSQREMIQQQFMNNQIDVICATSAFGMGIDKNDIRYVIHYHLPGSLQSYVQEIGRAGRDGAASIAILLYTTGDEYIARALNDSANVTDELVDYYWRKPNPDLTGQDVRLLNYYFTHGYSAEQVKQIFANQQRKRENNLQKMIAYVNCATCLRNFIKNEFGESLQVTEQQFCCDKDGHFNGDWQQFNTTFLTELSTNSSIKSWQEVLNHLFLAKN
ncbi:RecQ family ATP-dependent DNA helicase [Lentilactobacillus senioris]|uniref:RecQ family ATP-dependent DNA helicase n=1 Tax=Lentilactobacillus senioris TaxID=931534 RepID=UPI00227E2631|nr:RecQ family ATP-dependent DNA helicase [Lentilactobacillus senioris]MCY9806813.1 RecQ family ATP-dependent DNA helicase [Lentilactobacillus senioris]